MSVHRVLFALVYNFYKESETQQLALPTLMILLTWIDSLKPGDLIRMRDFGTEHLPQNSLDKSSKQLFEVVEVDSVLRHYKLKYPKEIKDNHYAWFASYEIRSEFEQNSTIDQGE